MVVEERLAMDVGKREDMFLDQISGLIAEKKALQRNRDAALDWITTYVESGVLDKETGKWLRGVLNGE